MFESFFAERLQNLTDRPTPLRAITDGADTQKKKQIRVEGPPDVQSLEIENPQDEDVADQEDEMEDGLDLEGIKKQFSQSNINQYTETGRLKYVDPLSIDVQPWDPLEVPPDSAFILFGKRRTGKSTFTRWLFSQYADKFPWATVFTGSKQDTFYTDFLPDDHVIDGFDSDVMSAIETFQKPLRESRERGELEGGSDNTYTIVWFDDLMSDRGMRFDSSFEAAYTRGRHLDIMVGFNAQSTVGVVPNIRKNADVVVLFTQFNSADMETIATEYLGRLNKRTAMELMDIYTQDKHALIIELWRNSVDPSEYLKVAKAELDIDPFQFGSREYWEGEFRQQMQMQTGGSMLF